MPGGLAISGYISMHMVTERSCAARALLHSSLLGPNIRLIGVWRLAVFSSVGLAPGFGLVMAVTAASSGVRAAQGSVLQNLYGVGTSATVTMPPSAGSFGLGGRNFNFKPVATVKIDQLTVTRSLRSLNESAGTTISKLNGRRGRGRA